MPTKYGLINVAGEFVLEPQYDAVIPADDQGGPTCVETDAASRRITPDGRVEGGRSAYVDRDGTPAFDGEYEGAGRFTEGLARVRVDDRWGYIDRSGAMRVERQFDMAFAFRGGFARVKVGNRYGYIDRWGEWVHPPQLRHAGDYSCGLAWASEGGGHGYLDVRGRWAIPPRYHWPENFADGLAFATNEDFAGYIDIAGRTVIEFDRAGRGRRLPEGLTAEAARELLGYRRPAWTGGRFSEGLAEVGAQEVLGGEIRCGYIDLKGELVIPLSFDSAGPFRGGHATVKVDGKWGIIDRTGHYTVPPTYDDALYGFGCGLAAVKEGGVYHYVDPGGVPAFGAKTFASAGPFANGIAPIGLG